MSSTILLAVIATGAIGLVAAVLLVVASKLMYVKADPRIAELREVLPGANCGACGFSGCDGYATALSKGEAAPDLCPPGGADAYKNICGILGVEAGEGSAGKAAVICCAGDAQPATVKMEYKGIRTCLAEEQHYGGRNACTFGCLGYGDCALACPSNAICIEGGIARVNLAKCGGCGICVKACPRGLIMVLPRPLKPAVLCKNTEKGAVVRKKCTKGCIACMKCVKQCPDGAITVKDSVAVIDYEKCTGCGKCVGECITKCIAAYE